MVDGPVLFPENHVFSSQFVVKGLLPVDPITLYQMSSEGLVNWNKEAHIITVSTSSYPGGSICVESGFIVSSMRAKAKLEGLELLF